MWIKDTYFFGRIRVDSMCSTRILLMPFFTLLVKACKNKKAVASLQLPLRILLAFNKNSTQQRYRLFISYQTTNPINYYYH